MGLMKAVGMAAKNERHKEKKPFGAIEVETVRSEAWGKLRSQEAHVYNTLKTFYHGEKKSFKAPFSFLKQRTRIKHGHTLLLAIKGLEEKGWVRVVRYAQFGKRRGLRVKANEYELTFIHDRARW